MFAIYFIVTHDIVVTPYYLFVLSVWVGLCLFFNFGGVYLARFQSLSEGAGYKFGMSLLLAWAVDTVLFDPMQGQEQFISIALCFLGGGGEF